MKITSARKNVGTTSRRRSRWTGRNEASRQRPEKSVDLRRSAATQVGGDATRSPVKNLSRRSPRLSRERSARRSATPRGAQDAQTQSPTMRAESSDCPSRTSPPSPIADAERGAPRSAVRGFKRRSRRVAQIKIPSQSPRKRLVASLAERAPEDERTPPRSNANDPPTERLPTCEDRRGFAAPSDRRGRRQDAQARRRRRLAPSARGRRRGRSRRRNRGRGRRRRRRSIERESSRILSRRISARRGSRSTGLSSLVREASRARRGRRRIRRERAAEADDR